MKILLIICFVFSVSSLYAQHKTIKGRVITEDLEMSPYTLIAINDTVKVGKTNLDGYFQIEIPFLVKKVQFMGIGMETASIELVDGCQEIEVVMLLNYTYDFMSPKKVDRKRKKRFNKLSELHKKAFEKGLFKTDSACYTQEFIPINKKNQK